MVCVYCFNRDCLLAKDALGARAESLQGLRALAASNPSAAKDYVASIEAQRDEALSRHLAGIAPGLNATNDQVIDYMGKSATARARLGEVMSPDQLQTTQKKVKRITSCLALALLAKSSRGFFAFNIRRH